LGQGYFGSSECEIELKTPGYRYREVQSARLTIYGYIQQAH